MHIRKLKREDLGGLISLFGHLHEGDISASYESTSEVWDQTERCGIVNYFGLFLKGTSGNPLFAPSRRYFRAQSVIYTA